MTAGVDLVSYAHPILINMVDRPERLADTLDELSIVAGRPIAAGRDVQLIRPVRLNEADAGGFAKAGYRSNLDAHLEAARWARSSGQERVVVLEDDVAFNPAWSRWGPALLAQLDARSWDLASLGFLDEWGEAPVTPDEAVEGSVAPEAPGGVGWARFAGRTNGAHAYLLQRSVLDDWIDHLTTVLDGEPGDDLRGPMPSDGAINTFFWIEPDRIRLVATPNMAGTRKTRSDIDPGLVDRIPLLGSVAEVGRRWYRRRGRGAINYR